MLLMACSASEREANPPGPPPLEQCWSLRTEDALPSMTQTYDVAVDAARGRAVATGLGLPVLSVIDLGSGVRTDAIAYAALSTRYPRVALDGAGVAWVASSSDPALVRVDLDTRAVTTVSAASDARWVVGLDDGVLIPRSTAASQPGVRRLDSAGALVAELDLTAARAAARHPEGLVVLTDAEAVVLDGSTGADALAERARCALPFSAEQVVALEDAAAGEGEGQVGELHPRIIARPCTAPGRAPQSAGPRGGGRP